MNAFSTAPMGEDASAATISDSPPNLYRLRFEVQQEAQFRTVHDENRRVARAAMFLIIALALVTAPLYRSLVFQTPDEFASFLNLVEIGIYAPLMLAVAYITWIRLPAAQMVQIAAVALALAGVIGLRVLALEHDLRYPLTLIGIIEIAMVIVGGFPFRRIAPLLLLASVLAAGTEVWKESDETSASVQVFLLVLMTAIAMASSYAMEILSRRAWWSMQVMREAEARARDSQTFLRSYLDNNPGLAFIKDIEGRYLYVSRALLRMRGIHDDSWRGRHDREYFPEALVQDWRAKEQHVLQHHEARQTIEPGWGRGEKYFQVTRFPFEVRNAGDVYLGGVATEVTDLELARRMAERAERVKTEFLANMSHEIRTPMNAVIGMTSVLLDSKLSADQKEWVEIIRSSGEHLMGLLNDILDYSKIEAGAVELETQAISVRECVESALDLVAGDAARRGVELGYFIQPGVPDGICADVARLRQVLLNLLSNAIKFSHPKGEVSVEVQAREDLDRYILQFTVKDSGMGISAEGQERLFRPFSQANASTTRVYGGTGLGLSICRRLVELMGGRIWVDSRPGEGAAFSFTIQAQAVAINRRITIPAEVPMLRGRRVLIVDDIEINRRILLHFCTGWGMEARATDRGEQALEWLARGDRYDLILLDFHMPVMDGLELASRIRAAYPVPLIMLSSVNLNSRQRSQVTAALLKPIKPMRLLKVLQETLRNGSAPSPVVAEESESLPTLGQTHPLHILVAEDNAVNQKVARLLLGRLGYQSDFVGNGREVLDAVLRRTYDVVLMDVQMPEMDGIEATREICQRYAPDQRPRIVGMTANAAIEERRTAEAAGMDDYLTKPMTADALVTALRKCRSRSVINGAQAAAAPAEDAPPSLPS